MWVVGHHHRRPGIDRRVGRLHGPRRHYRDVLRPEMEVGDDNVRDRSRGCDVLGDLGGEVRISPGTVICCSRVEIEHTGRWTRLDFVVRGYRVDTEKGDSRLSSGDDPGRPGGT